MKKSPARGFAVLLGYGAITVVATYPAAWGFFSTIPGYGQDDFQFYWNFWWVQRAIFEEGTHPLFTKMLFHPEGASLVFHTLSLYNTLILGIPFQWWMGITGTFNLAFLSAFALTGYWTFRLILRVTNDPVSSFVGGLITAFSPYHFAHVQHLNLISLQFMPLYILSLVALRDRPGAARGISTGVIFSLLFLCSYHYGLFAFYFTLFFWIWFFFDKNRQTRKSPQIRSLIIAGVTAAILLSPVVVPMIQGFIGGEFERLSDGARGTSADLLAFFLPSPFHPWTRGWSSLQSVYAAFSASREEGTVFLGYVALLLAVIGAVRARSGGAMFWAAAFMAFCLLALGPDLQVGGEEWLGFTRLPYNWFVQKFPLLNAARNPGRFVSVATVCLGVLAGFGLSVLLKHRNGAARWGAAALAGCLILFEYWSAPLPVVSVWESHAAPPYKTIAQDEGRFGVLEVPVRGYLAGNSYMFAQTFHGRPITSGTVSHLNRAALRFIRNDPFMRLLTRPERIVDAPDPETQGVSQAGIRYVILHRNALFWVKPDSVRGKKKLRAVEGLLDRLFERLPESTGGTVLYRVGPEEDGKGAAGP